MHPVRSLHSLPSSIRCSVLSSRKPFAQTSSVRFARDALTCALSRLQVRALLQHHGSFDKCPATLTATVLEVETHSQSATTRRKLEPMAHIPLTSEFRLVEIELSEILPEASIEPFKKELTARSERRERERAKAAREEERVRAAEARARKPAVFAGLAAMPLPHEVRHPSIHPAIQPSRGNLICSPLQRLSYLHQTACADLLPHVP